MKTYKVIKEFTNKVHIECSCGNIKSIKKSKLQHFNCPCVNLNSFNKDERKSFARTKNRINNTKKEIPFGLSEEHYKHLIHQNCFYCNNPPRVYSDGSLVNGIDRVDSNKGYETENVITCCSTCNRMKGTMSYKEFRDHLVTIVASGNERDTMVVNASLDEHSHVEMCAWMFKRGAYYPPFDVLQMVKEGYLKREDIKYSLRKSAWDFTDRLNEILTHFKPKIEKELGYAAFKTIKNKRPYIEKIINTMFNF
jgi:5-methylcytosine-specific restriction endonuclease McrA